MKERKPLSARFWKKVEKTSGCWIWKGKHQVKGYGQLGGYDGGMLTHRASWILTHGSIPDGMDVLHRCDVRLCVRPSHLWLGTDSDNQLDSWAKGRRNHVKMPSGSQHWNATLDENDAKEVKRLLIEGNLSQRRIGARFGISQAMVSRIKVGLAWRGI